MLTIVMGVMCAVVDEPRLPSGDVSPVCWTLLSVLGGALSAVVLWALSILKDRNAIQDARIADLKANNALADTLLDVVLKERKGGA